MFWVLRESTFHQKSGECHDLQRKQIKIIFLKIICINRYLSLLNVVAIYTDRTVVITFLVTKYHTTLVLATFKEIYAGYFH